MISQEPKNLNIQYAVVRNAAEKWINKPAGSTNDDLMCLNFDLSINYKTLKNEKTTEVLRRQEAKCQ